MMELALTWLELLCKGVPESVLLIVAAYVITNSEFNKRKIMVASVIFIAMVYIIRMLPIQRGVNILLSAAIFMIVLIHVCKVDLYKAIKAVISVSVVLLICDWLNIRLLIAVYGASRGVEISNSHNVIYSLPSTFFFAGAVTILFIIMKRKNKTTNMPKIDNK